MRPRTIFGITNVFTEQLGRYYFLKYNVDFRCLRYPGIVSSTKQKYYGLTSYATRMIFEAYSDKRCICTLKEDTQLPFLHVDDAVKATMKLIEADQPSLTRRVYNLPGVSFTPAELAAEIKK